MRKALIVGVNYYPWLGSLAGCSDDAQSIAELLESHEDHRRNFDGVTRCALDAASPITRKELRDQIIALFRDQHDLSLFYFAGHGGYTGDAGYLLTSDCEDVSGGIPFEDLIHAANASPANNRIIVLDCCSGGSAGAHRATDGASVLREGTTILAAARTREQAVENHGCGMFTSLFADALRGGAADILGNITPGAIYAHIDKALGSWEQRPVFKTNTKEFASLRSVAAQISIPDLHQITSLFQTPTSTLALDPSFEPTCTEADLAHLPDPENCRKFSLLQSYCRLNLLRPVGETHMYYAAMNSRECKLTPLGQHYWNLVKKRRV